MVILILTMNHVVDAGLSGTMVESHVMTDLIKMLYNMRGEIVKIGVLGIHMFVNQSEVLLLSSFKSITPT